jgi:hypothetical protein
MQTDSSLIPPQAPPVPAGGVASPPTDPPPASGKPLQGQEETNRPLTPLDETPETARAFSEEDQILWRAAAMDLGRMTYFRHAGEPLEFEQAEEELSRAWDKRQRTRDQRVSWEKARELARDAWDQARSALAFGNAKSSAR